ncbi:MAG: phage portal protein [Clostridiales bacterium]|jgi:lambda family phage portal protein|nr:phage portal protein [Clostridiales bacterium]
MSESKAKKNTPRNIRNLSASGYSNSAASLTKPVFKGWSWTGGSPDDDIIANLPVIRQRSRQLTMEAPVIAGLYKTLTTNCVGDGLRPEPAPDVEFLGMSPEDASKFKSSVLRFWELFAETPNCDVFRRDNFYELTRLVSRAQDESGDVFVTLPMFERKNIPFALKLQVIEADCVADPEGWDPLKYQMEGADIFGGVELSERGHVLAYWFYIGHPLSHKPTSVLKPDWYRNPWVRIPAYGEETGRPNVLHMMESLRPGQRRGIPLITPTIEMALTLDRYMKAEAIAAQIQAMFTVIVTSDIPEAMAADMSAMFDGEVNGVQPGNDDIFMGNGTIMYARPGEKVEPIDPSRPHSVFGEFIGNVLQMWGPSVGIPYEMLIQKFDASYSASRAAINMAASNFKVKRAGLVHDFCQPVYEAFMDEAVARGWIPAKGYYNSPVARRAYTRASWSGPGMPQIDPVKEVAAYKVAIDLGLISRSKAAREYNGTDYYQNVQELARELEEAKRAGLSPTELITVDRGGV